MTGTMSRRVGAGLSTNATKRVEAVTSTPIDLVFQPSVFQPEVFQVGSAVHTELTKRVGHVPGPTVQG